MSELNIPETWAEVDLGDIFEITSSKRVFQSEWKDEGIPFYRAREIVKLSKNGFVNNELFISKDMYREYAEIYGIPKKDDVLVTAVGTLGVPYLVKEGDQFYFKDGNIIWIKNSGKLFGPYLEKLFYSNLLKAQIGKGGGSTVGTYTIIKAKNTRIPLPPHREQERIVQKIESCFEKIDETELSLNKVEVLLEKYRESLLAKAFRGELIPQNPDDEPASVLLSKIREEREKTELGKKKKVQAFAPIEDDEKPFDIPDSWEWVKFGELIVKARYGTSERCHEVKKSSDVPVLRMGNIKNGELDLTSLKYLSKQKLDSSLILEQGDILFNRTNSLEHVGKSAVFELDDVWSYAGYLISAKVCNNVSPKFLVYYINSLFGRDYIERVATNTGRAQSNVNAEKMKEMPIPLPPYQVQLQIEKILQKSEELINFQKNITKEKYTLLDKIKESTLSKAFEGRLVEQIESEGTGHELLEKILAKRKSEEVTKKLKKKVAKKKTKKSS